MAHEQIYGPIVLPDRSDSDSDEDDDSVQYSVNLVKHFYSSDNKVTQTASQLPTGQCEHRTNIVVDDSGVLRSAKLALPSLRVRDATRELEMMPCEFTGKVVLLGSSGVGKTQMLLAGTDGRRNDVLQSTRDLARTNSTIGVDFRIVTRLVGDSNVLKLMIWDTAGQERYNSLMPRYVNDADGVLLVYDITNRQSFGDMERLWMPLIKGARECNERLVVLLVGNKIDCVERRAVPAAEIAAFANRHQLPNYFETTVLRRRTVYELLDAMAASVYHTRAADRYAGLSLSDKPAVSKSRCCGK